MTGKTKRLERLARLLDRSEDYVEGILVLSLSFISIMVGGLMVFQYFSDLTGGNLKSASAVISLLGTFLVLTLIFSLSSGPIRRLKGKKVLPWIISAGTIGLIGNILITKFNPLESPVKGAKAYTTYLVMFSVMLFSYLVVDSLKEENLEEIIS